MKRRIIYVGTLIDLAAIFEPDEEAERIEVTNVIKFKFRMLRRYRKIKVDMPLFSGEDRGRYSVCNHFAAKLLSFISFYLHLSPSIYKASGACES